MSVTLQLDALGNLFIPAEALAASAFAKGAMVEVAAMPDGILVRPAVPSVEAKLVRNEKGQLVLRGGGRITNEEIVRAIKADREGRIAELSSRHS